MKKLIASAYQLSFNLFGLKQLSYGAALLYITINNLIFLYGAGILLEGWLSFFSIVPKLYSFPFIAGTFAIMLLVTYMCALNRHEISKESKKVRKFTFLLVYSGISLLILAYVMFIRSSN